VIASVLTSSSRLPSAGATTEIKGLRTGHVFRNDRRKVTVCKIIGVGEFERGIRVGATDILVAVDESIPVLFSQRMALSCRFGT
jgi:hypothetical protein